MKHRQEYVIFDQKRWRIIGRRGNYLRVIRGEHILSLNPAWSSVTVHKDKEEQ